MSRGVALSLAGAAAGAAAANGAVRRLARRSLPRTDGRLALSCLDAAVEVVRDRFGIPHIYASGVRDLARAQGYVHAQDRLFQMEILRRLTFGRLSELAGPRTLELDRFVRRLRIGWAAEREAANLDPETAAQAEAYCEGVNEYIAHGPPPLELRLARVHPEPWRPADVQAPGKLLALALSVNWESELVRMRMAARLGEERARRLDPSVPYGAPLIVPDGLARAAARRGGWLRRLIGGGASNSWVVAGSRTASGKPLVANDPHLQLGIPPIWHAQHLSWDEGEVFGFSLPGSPGIVLGRNERLAWGMTAAFADTQDLSLERLHPDDPHRYEADGVWVEAEVVREEIRVRGRRKPVVEEVVITHHGPVVAGPEPGSNEVLALRWSAHLPGHTGRALWELMQASTVEEADRALGLFAGPPVSVILADAEGAIGYRLAGGPIPRREAGEGLVPAPGWDSAHEWWEWIPDEQLPRLRDPERGFIVTANNRIVGDDYPHFLGSDYMNGYRAQRIETLLEELDVVTVDDCRRIQLDQVSLPGLRLGEIARTFEAEDPLERRALELLRAWDGEYGPESAAGAVYGVLMQKLQEEVYSELGEDLPYFLGAGRSEATAGFGLFERTRPLILQMLAARDDAFFADGRTWETVFRKALAETVRELGPDPSGWRWGDIHQVRFDHAFGELRLVGRLFSRGPYPAGGDTDTVWQMAWPVDRPYGPSFVVGPSMRAVFDLGDPDGNHIVIPTGQSGHVASSHYDDFIPLWRSGELVPLAMTREKVEALAESRLLLEPV